MKLTLITFLSLLSGMIFFTNSYSGGKGCYQCSKEEDACTQETRKIKNSDARTDARRKCTREKDVCKKTCVPDTANCKPCSQCEKEGAKCKEDLKNSKDRRNTSQKCYVVQYKCEQSCKPDAK